MFEKIGAVFGGSLSDLDGEVEDIREELFVTYLGRNAGNQVKRLKRDRTRQHQLTRTNLKNGRAGSLGNFLKPIDALGKEFDPRFRTAHRQPPAKFAPLP